MKDVDILAERVRFDIIGTTESGHELRVQTDGDRVVWEDDEGRSGYMPAMLFRLAAHQLAHYCEDVCCAVDANPEDRDNFITAWDDSVSCPVDLAMAHPYWAQPDHDANDLRFGFTSIASAMSTDGQPEHLRPRRISIPSTSEILDSNTGMTEDERRNLG